MSIISELATFSDLVMQHFRHFYLNLWMHRRAHDAKSDSNGLMIHLLILLTIWLASATAYGDTAENPSYGMVTMDMRHGLPESRIRALCVLPDGRLAVATAGYISIFDGIRFVNEPIDRGNGIVIASRGKNRKLFYDYNGILWLKTPVSHSAETGRLHAFDAVSGKDITKDVIPILGEGKVCDFFVDDTGSYMIIDEGKNLCIVNNKKRENLINIGSVGKELPAAVYGDDERIYLCYDNGKVCVVNRQTRLLESISRAPLPKMDTRLINGIVREKNGRLWIPYHRHNDYSTSWMAGLDATTETWNVRQLDRLIYDFVVNDNDSIIYSFSGQDDEIFCMGQDKKGGIWIGTSDSGLRHIASSGKRPITLHKGVYPCHSMGYFPDKKAIGPADKYAPGILNCSAVDRETGYMYLGTRKGLMIINKEGKCVGILNGDMGLPNDNVQSVIVNEQYKKNKKRAPEVWFTTTTGLSRLRHLDGDTLEVINLGIVDGLDLNGKEFSTQSIAVDTLGYIIAGYSGGWCRLNPAAIDNAGYVIHKYPDGKEPPTERQADISGAALSVLLICVCVLIVISLAIFIAIYHKRQKRYSNTRYQGNTAHEVSGDYVTERSSTEKDESQWSDNLVERLRETVKSSSAESGSQDMEFVTKVNNLIESHLDDETLSVVSLSAMMAMDRTNLYRRMQTVTGKSPSAYIKDMRLSVAARLLKETDLSIHDIASRTGFSSAKYFSASFKERFGMLPAKYRDS